MGGSNMIGIIRDITLLIVIFKLFTFFNRCHEDNCVTLTDKLLVIVEDHYRKIEINNPKIQEND